MELTFVAKNTTLTDAIKDYAVKRLAKLDRRFKESAPVQLEIRKEGARQENQRYIAEVTIRLKGGMIRSEERGVTPYAAIDEVEATLDGRIQKYKSRFERRRKGASRFQQEMLEHFVEAPEPIAKPTEPMADGRVVKTKQHPVTPMSVEDAAAQMDLLGHNFFVFLNKDSHQINVVYLRQDDDYGLIVPEVTG